MLYYIISIILVIILNTIITYIFCKNYSEKYNNKLKEVLELKTKLSQTKKTLELHTTIWALQNEIHKVFLNLFDNFLKDKNL